MGEEEFRLPGSSYDEIVKIIRGYGHFDADVPLKELSKVAGVHETIVSRNNAFLVGVGIVQGGQRKVITPQGKALARALDHQMADEIAQHWRDLILSNQFFQKLLAAVRIRRGMDPSTLQAHIAYSAGQKRSPGVMAGASAIAEIMIVARVLKEADGKLVATDETLSTDLSETIPVSDRSTGTVAPSVRSVAIGPVSTGPISVQIQLQIQCTPDQLDDVANKLRDLIERVTAPRQAAE